MDTFKIIWSPRSINSLKKIHHFYCEKSETAANNIINDIVAAPNLITFPYQYQKDNINPKYRRIIVRDYKLLYTVDYNIITIVNVISSKQNPEIYNR